MHRTKTKCQLPDMQTLTSDLNKEAGAVCLCVSAPKINPTTPFLHPPAEVTEAAEAGKQR